MIRRSPLVSLLAGSILISGNAFAHWQIAATTGLPADSYNVNGGFPPVYHWRWNNDVFVSRISNTTTPLEWMIPLIFQGSSMNGNLWTAQVWVSANVRCNLVWKSDVQNYGSAATNVVSRSTAGLLDLTVDPWGNSLCPGADSQAPACVTTYANAYVLCRLAAVNDFVGPVLYSITPHS